MDLNKMEERFKIEGNLFEQGGFYKFLISLGFKEDLDFNTIKVLKRSIKIYWEHMRSYMHCRIEPRLRRNNIVPPDKKNVPNDPVGNILTAVNDFLLVLEETESYGVIMGGLAVQEYGYERYTNDVDVVVGFKEHGLVVEQMEKLGYESFGGQRSKHKITGVCFDNIGSGSCIRDEPDTGDASISTEFRKANAVPDARKLGPNGCFIYLPALIELKLRSEYDKRPQDKIDIIELLKVNMDKRQSILDSLTDDELKTRFVNLVPPV